MCYFINAITKKQMDFKNPIQLLQKIGRKIFGVDNVGQMPLAYGRTSIDPKQDLTGYKISADSFFAVYKNQADVFACVREYQQNVLAAGYNFIDANNPEQKPDPTFVKKANSVLNFFAPWRVLKARMIRDYMVSGNNYGHLVPNKAGTDILGIQPFDPRTVSIVSNRNGKIYKYIQKVNTDTINFEADSVAHWKNGNDPNHEIFGMSPIEPILWEARTDLAAMLQNFFFFKNNATPDVMYILDEKIKGKEAVEEAINNIKNQFQGVTNSHKSAVLAGVKEVKTINITQKDMEYLGGRRFTTEKICSCYGVPKVVLNYTDGVNYSTAQIQYIKFIENSVMPVEEDLIEFFNREVWTKVMINGVPLSEKIKMIPLAQKTEAQGNIEDRALNEYRSGALTLRQYKKKTGQEISEDEDSNPMFDEYILQQGASAVLLDDVGVDPIIDPNSDASAQKMIRILENFKKKIDEQN